MSNETEAPEKGTSLNMKKFFKSPEDLEASSYKAYRDQRLKKVLSRDIKDHTFLFVTNFKFSDKEDAPMLFFGSPNGFWKKAIQGDYKRRREFAMGTCTKAKQEKTGKEVLQLTVTKGKGQNPRNKKRLEKELLKKFKLTVEFVEAKETKSLLAQLQDKIVGAKELPGESVTSAAKSIIRRLQQEVQLFKRIPPADIEQRTEKIRLLELLIAEWEKESKTDAPSSEKKYVSNVKAFLQKAQKNYNSKSLQSAEVKEMLEDFKDSRGEFAEYLKEMQQAKVAMKLPGGDWPDDLEAPEDAAKGYYRELQLQDEAIKNWEANHPDANSKDLKTLTVLKKQIHAEQTKIAKQIPNVETLDKNQQDIKKITDRIMETINRLKKDNPKNLDEKAALVYYQELKSRKQELLDWMEFHKGHSSKSDSKIASVHIKAIAKAILSINKLVSEDEKLDNYEIQDFKNAFAAFEQEKAKLPSKDVGIAQIEPLCKSLDNQLRDIRLWTKANKQASPRDKKILTELSEKIRKNYKDLEALLSDDDKTELHKAKGYSPADLDNLNEKTKLPTLDKKLSLTATGTYAKIIAAYKAYEEMSNDEIELKRLKLLEMSGYITTWQNNWDSKSATKKKLDLLGSKREKEVAKLRTVMYEKIKLLADFGAKRDNTIQIERDFKNFKIWSGEYENYIDYEDSEEYMGLDRMFRDEEEVDESLKAALASDLEAVIDDIEFNIKDWQKLHNNLSDFGTKKENERMEEVRKAIHDFAHRMNVQEIKKIKAGKSKEFTSIVHDDINRKLKAKKPYNPDGDHAYWDLKEAIRSYDEKGGQWKKNQHQIDRIEKLQGLIKSFRFYSDNYTKHKELEKRKKQVDKWEKALKKHTEGCEKVEKEEKGVARLKAMKKEIGKADKRRVKADAQIKKIAKKLAKLSGKKRFAAEDQIALLQKVSIRADQELEELYREWREIYDGFTEIASKKKYKQSNLIFKGRQKTVGERKQKDQSKEEKEKDVMIERIRTIYGKADFNCEKADHSEAEKQHRLGKIEYLERVIKAWENIPVCAKDEAQKKKYEDEIKELQGIEKALEIERKKFDGEITPRKDAFFMNIEKQFENVKKMPAAGKKVKAMDQLNSAIAFWKKKNPNEHGVGAADKYKKLLEIADYINDQAKGDCEIYALIEAFDASVGKIKKRLNDYEKGEFKLEEDYLKYQHSQLDTKAKEQRDILVKAAAEGDKNAASKAMQALDDLNDYMQESETNMLISANEDAQEKERLELSVFSGFEAYDNFENVDSVMPDKEKKKIEAIVAGAVDRAHKMQALGASAEEAKEMLRHIPNTFWPDDFVEEMRLWQQAEEAYFEKEIKSFTDQSLKEQSKTIQTKAKETLKHVSVVNDLLKTGQMKMTVMKPDKNGDLKPVGVNVNIFAGGTDSIGKQKSELETESEVSAVIGLGGTGLGVIQDFIGGVGAVEKIHDEKEAKKKAALIGKFILDTTQKLCAKTSGVMNSSLVKAVSNDEAKVAAQVISATAQLLGILNREVKKDRKDSGKEKDPTEQLIKIAEGMIQAGKDVMLVVKIFAGFGKTIAGASSAAGSAFATVGGGATVGLSVLALLGDAVALAKLVRKAAKNIEARSKLKNLQGAAVQQDSVMKHALRREMKSMNLKIAKDVVDITSKSVELAGSATLTVGGVVSMVPEPEVMAAGMAITIAGTAIKISGKVISLSGKAVFEVIDQKDRKEAEELLKLARKGDRGARLKILEKSRKYAKAFLAAGVMQNPPDPIALEFCLQKGITQKDLEDEATAQKVLKKLLKNAGEPEDETYIVTKLANKAKAFKDWVEGPFQDPKKLNIKLQADTLKKDVTDLLINYKQLRKTGILYGILTGLTETGREATKEIMDNATIVKNQLKVVKTKLGKRKEGINKTIDVLYTEVEDLNKEIEKDNQEKDFFQEAVDKEEDIEKFETLVVAIDESLEVLKGIKIESK